MAARLGSIARARREQAGLRLIDIAITANVAESTIHFFETGNGWRRETDRIVDAYAELLGCTPQDIWQSALSLETDP